MKQGGLFKRALHTLSSQPSELEAEELQDSVTSLGATPVVDCPDRQQTSVAGILRTVTLRPRAGAPALEADLWDGSGTVNLVWLGRRRIAGIEPGRHVKAHGRICTIDGDRVIYNPTYDLLPPEE
ncbi:MAG: OB-fold nucleic acid binding domain-containing protein [Frankiaceae bacterium]